LVGSGSRGEAPVGLWEADEARARGYEEAIGGGEDMADDALLARCEVEGNLGGKRLGKGTSR